MDSYPLPPNPFLVAILLLVKTTSEPRIIFHYPPKPGEDNSQYRDMFKEHPTDDDSSSSSSDDESQDSSAETPKPVEQKEDIGTGQSTPEVDETGSASPEKDGLKAVKAKLQWNDLFGYQSSILSRILLPAVSGHKKRFEVGLDDLVFLGRPIFAKPDGTWKKPKKLRRSSSKSNVTAEKVRDVQDKKKGTKVETFDYANKDSGTSGLDTGTESQPDSHRNEETLKREEAVEGGEPVEHLLGTKSSEIGNSDMLLPKKEKQKPLAMFHVVFVLRPPALEYHLRLKEMYDNVTKKLSKAMKWEQSRSGYVAREAAMISSLTKHMDKSNSKLSPEISLTIAHMYRRKGKSSNIISRHNLAIYSRESYIIPIQQYHRLSNRPCQFRSGLVAVSPAPVPHFHPNSPNCTCASATRPLANDCQFHTNRRRCSWQWSSIRGIFHPLIVIRRPSYPRRHQCHRISDHRTFDPLSPGHHIQQIISANLPILRHSPRRNPIPRLPPHLLATSSSDPPTPPTRHLHRLTKR